MFVIKDYEHLVGFYNDIELKWCFICNKQTLHIIHGFKGELRCLNCNGESK
jgi:hypothetical protein